MAPRAILKSEVIPPIGSLDGIFSKIASFSSDSLVNFISPEALEKGMEILLENPSAEVESLEKTVEFLMSHCVNTSHPQFVSQLYGGVNPVGLAASMLIEKMNTNQHTFEAAPVFVLAERLILRQLRQLFYGSHHGDGIFCPGGSLANFYALVTARHCKFPEIKKIGLFGLPPMVIFTSEDAHYSAFKMANWMGLGHDNVVKIPTQKDGAMVTSLLAKAIGKCKGEGKVALAVIATIGTTVLGAFDNLEEIADICHREKVWLHCDAAWGGAFVFSPKLKSKWLQGIERCDSIVWNAHKMLGAPLQCSAFITKQPNVLSPCNTVVAPYLFQTNKHYNETFDETGDKSVQCGRKSDAFKLFLMWSSLGPAYFQRAIEQTEACADYFTRKIQNDPNFLLYLDHHQCTNVFFWYIPKSLRDQERNADWWKQLGELTIKIRTALLLRNEVMIGYAPLPEKEVPNALRLVLTAYPPKTFANMDFIIEKITGAGDML